MANLDDVHPENVARCRPGIPCGTGVLVVAGSSGTLPSGRAKVLAGQGADAIALRWFGGPGQQSTPVEIELELFMAAVDALARTSDRVAIVGASFGAEAAISVAVRHPDIDAVVAIAPTTHVWPGPSESGESASHWTWNGSPLPFVALADGWAPTEEPPAFRTWYERSLAEALDPDAARIPVENFEGELVLVAGGDDQVWPSAEWAADIENRRDTHHRPTRVISHHGAGHRPILPGERPAEGGRRMRRGGSPSADSRLGHDAWPHIVSALGLRPDVS